MTFFQVRTANFGQTFANLTGSTGIGFTLFDLSGIVTGSRVTGSVYQLSSGSGIYGANIEFPTGFNGSILWDTGTELSSSCGVEYATEQYNVEENNPHVDDIFNIEYGRWEIDGTEMIFYKSDNVTEIARFDLFDSTGTPSSDSVFERLKK